MMDTLARLLDLPPAAVRSAQSLQGALARSGLLAMDRTGSGHLRQTGPALGKFADPIMACETDTLSLLRDTIRPSVAAKLALNDYQRLDHALTILKP